MRATNQEGNTKWRKEEEEESTYWTMGIGATRRHDCSRKEDSVDSDEHVVVRKVGG